jgi:TorA maturation chaperone TorD
VIPVEPSAAEIEVLADRALRRAARYRLLAAGLGPPTQELAHELRDGAGWAEAEGDSPALRAAAAAFRGACDRLDVQALRGEHLALFGGQVRCSPYESSYGDGRRLGGKTVELADIAGFYAAFGLEPSAGHPEMVDHIAAELEFMSALALKEAWALAEGHAEGLEVTRRAAVSFLTDHLGRWAEAFAGALREATPLPYFGALADLLEAWVRHEIEAAGAAPARVAGRSGHDPIQQEAFTCPAAGAAVPEPPADQAAPAERSRRDWP